MHIKTGLVHPHHLKACPLFDIISQLICKLCNVDVLSALGKASLAVRRMPEINLCPVSDLKTASLVAAGAKCCMPYLREFGGPLKKKIHIHTSIPRGHRPRHASRGTSDWSIHLTIDIASLFQGFGCQKFVLGSVS
jgi:hypothetical protein